jgi:hypothetical protein
MPTRQYLRARNPHMSLTNPLHFFHDAWQDVWRKAAPACERCDSMRLRSRWRRLHRRSSGVCLHGRRYCGTDCLRQALLETLGQIRPAPRRAAITSHRVPLGLLMLSRQQLSSEQLRNALEAQRQAGGGRIGEWLQQLGFASELEVTAALARQWGCPLLRGDAANLFADHCPEIPLPLLESFQMIPVEFGKAARTLLVGFSGGVDHSALYAIERMLGYHTEPCLVTASKLRQGLLALRGSRISDDVVFDRVEDSECARIIGSYAAKLAARDIRLAGCGKHVWARFERAEGRAFNIVLTAPDGVMRKRSNNSGAMRSDGFSGIERRKIL